MPPESTVIFFALLIGLPPLIRFYREDTASTRQREYFNLKNRLHDAARPPRRRQPHTAETPTEEPAGPTPEQIAQAIIFWEEGRGRK